MADQYRNLLKHPKLLKVLEQMEHDGSGSASGSGDQGSGEKFAMEDYVKLIKVSKTRHKSKHGSRKGGIKESGLASKNSDVSKMHPVPLSNLDIELIDALSSGAPSESYIPVSSLCIFVSVK